MGLSDRVGMIFLNLVILIPVLIMLVVTSILTGKLTDDLKTVEEVENVDEIIYYLNAIKYTLWGITAMCVLFVFTLPLVTAIPYLYGFVMITLSLALLTIASYYFYLFYTIRGNRDSKDAVNKLIASGSMMAATAIFLIVYSIYTIRKYSKSGGVTGDVAVVGDLAFVLGQPEIGVPLKAIGEVAKGDLTAEQQTEAAKRSETAQNLLSLVDKNPELAETLLKFIKK